jgi:ubiquinone/menaquinone biosynthesis C-methylase UbiE
LTWEHLRSTYDQVATKYESRFLGELDGKPRDRDLLARIAESVGDPVVEIGCGPGQIGAFVRARGRYVVGLDLSVEMARLALRRLDAALTADMRSLPFASGRVGGLLAFYSIIHLPRTEVSIALEEFHRVLRPGGRILLSAHQGEGQIDRDDFLEEHAPFVATLFELDELISAATAVGFDVTLAERRPPYETESGTVRLYIEAERPA